MTNAQLSPNMIVKHEDVYESIPYKLKSEVVGVTNPDLASSFHLGDANSFRKHMFAVNTSCFLPLLDAPPPAAESSW